MRATRQAQHHRQFTQQLDTRFAARYRGWMDLHAINQGAGRLQRLSAAISQKGLPQARHLGTVDLSEVAVKPRQLWASLSSRDF
jgi:hypothetical protein